MEESAWRDGLAGAMCLTQTEFDSLSASCGGDPLLTLACAFTATVRNSSLDKKLGFGEAAFASSAPPPKASDPNPFNPFAAIPSNSNQTETTSEPSPKKAAKVPWFVMWAVVCLQRHAHSATSWSLPWELGPGARTHVLQGALYALRQQYRSKEDKNTELLTSLPPGVEPAMLLSTLLEFLRALPERPVTAEMDAASRV